MIPILYPADEPSKGSNAFKTNGLGRLSDAITCTVTEEKNGIYELSMKYPHDGIHVKDISENKIIYAEPSVGKHPQPFRIREITKTWGDRINIVARHLCYELSYYPCSAFGTGDVIDYRIVPVLYNSSKQAIGVLTDAYDVFVTKSGKTYTLTLKYPSTGSYYQSVTSSAFILLQPETNKQPILFDISTVTVSAGVKTVTVSAGVKTVTATGTEETQPATNTNKMTVSQAVSRIKTSAEIIGTNSDKLNIRDWEFPFTFTTVPYEPGDEWSTNVQEFWNEAPVSVRELIMNDSDRLLDVYGGEWEWDHYNCMIHEYRGQDNGVIFMYGKNITDINESSNIDDLYTHVFSYWKGTESSSTNKNNGEYFVQYGNLIQAFDEEQFGTMLPKKRTLIIDASSDFEEKPTREQLDDYSNWYIKLNEIGVPKVSITVDVVDLASTEEYKDYAPFETVHLCDSVSIIFPEYDIHTKAEVSQIVYNVLKGKNDSVTIGETKVKLADVIASNKYSIRKTKYDTQEWADKCAERATRASNGWYGGNIRKNYNTSDHKQQSMYVMDSDNIGTANHALSFNSSGIGAVTGVGGGGGGGYNALISLHNPLGQIGINGSGVNFGTLSSQGGNGNYWNMETGDASMTFGGGVVSATAGGLTASNTNLSGTVAVNADTMAVASGNVNISIAGPITHAGGHMNFQGTVQLNDVTDLHAFLVALAEGFNKLPGYDGDISWLKGQIEALWNSVHALGG